MFKNPEQNAGGFLLSSNFGRPNLRLGHIFGAPKFAVSPLEIPFLGPQNPKIFSRASRAGFYFVQKISRASRGFLFCSFFLPDFRVGFYFVQFSFPQNPPGFLLKGGFIPWCLVDLFPQIQYGCFKSEFILSNFIQIFARAFILSIFDFQKAIWA